MDELQVVVAGSVRYQQRDRHRPVRDVRAGRARVILLELLDQGRPLTLLSLPAAAVPMARRFPTTSVLLQEWVPSTVWKKLPPPFITG